MLAHLKTILMHSVTQGTFLASTDFYAKQTVLACLDLKARANDFLVKSNSDKINKVPDKTVVKSGAKWGAVADRVGLLPRKHQKSENCANREKTSRVKKKKQKKCVYPEYHSRPPVCTITRTVN